MLKPEIRLIKEHAYCVCGAPNFRNVNEFHKPMFDIYEVTIPTRPCGQIKHHLCADCIKNFTKRVVEN